MAGTRGKRTKWSKESATAVLDTTRDEPGPLLISLQALQSRFGYVCDKDIELVAAACNVSRAEVHGVLTFYRDLRRTPPPNHLVQICVAEACQSLGSRSLVEAIERSCGTRIGETNADVEIQAAYCLGNCALGPAAFVDEVLIGRSTVEKIRSELSKSELRR
ncbi:MAG: NAD(P)H-dependent oxidoreductase subunit E [Actinobacteria bacterium]|nr:NAD(P)H-dependent oxidoreductase subunit E [Actinomycetota bacterium]